MKYLAIGVALALGASPAAAQTWHLIGAVGESPDRFARWIEAESIQRDGSMASFQVREVREGPSAQGYDGALLSYRVNCETRGYETVRMVVHMADGRTRDIPGDGTMSPAPPLQTVVGWTIEMGCGRHPLGDAVRDPAVASGAFWDK